MKRKRPPARAKRPSTALARRPAAVIDRPQAILPASTSLQLTDDAALGLLGQVEVKLTDAEERVLARPAQLQDVSLKPTGQPYLSHPVYTRWFNEAFGRLGWAIVPVSKPLRQDHHVVQPYVLYIHGQPAAFAMGEQEYFESNRDQTYGEALEATVASALRRCAKRLGVGLELWDRRWLDAFVNEHGVKVRCTVKLRDGQEKVRYQWRLRSAPKFWNEISGPGKAGDMAEETQRRGEPSRGAAKREQPAGEDRTGHLPITDAQITRLWTIVKRAGRSPADVKRWLELRYKVASSKDIKRRDYENLCHAIEHPGELLVQDEPGAEG